jgi:hypothetical protein
VRVGRCDLTRSSAKGLATRFAIRSFPTLLFFPPNSEALYKYTGARAIEQLAAYATGGWKETEAYDPSKEPPPKPRQPFATQVLTLVSKHQLLFSVLGAAVVTGLIYRVYSLSSQVRSSAPAKAAGSPARTYGNKPLSQQTDSPASAAGSPARTYGNVPLSQQASPGSPASPPRTYGNTPLSQQASGPARRTRSQFRE